MTHVMNRWTRLGKGALFVVLVALTACATTPFPVPDDANIQAITPSEAIGITDAEVLWGGVIVDVAVLSQGTQLDVLAYRLNKAGRPQPGATTGRFLAVTDRFLEPLDYAPGRQLSVLGRLAEPTELSVGDHHRSLPTVAAHDLHLWRPGEGVSPQVSFGVGISISN